MLKKKLEEYKKKNNLTWEEVAQEIGVSRMGLFQLIKKRSPKTLVITCIKIEKLTGLSPWEYLDGLNNLKKLTIKK